jgi:hypothetical protein
MRQEITGLYRIRPKYITLTTAQVCSPGLAPAGTRMR